MKKVVSICLLCIAWMAWTVAAAEGLIVQVEEEKAFTPGRERCGKSGCFWETPMDAMNEAAVWDMLTAPMTVLDGDPRAQITLRAEPDADSAAIGEVTCASQGVHVLEDMGNGWSRIECYSSSFKGSDTQAWNALLTGYVPTPLLMEKQVKTKYGFVVDKLDQRLYIYEEGNLLDVLAVSTGLVTEGKPYNETRSGEYILWSLSGAFADGRSTCNYGIRYNDGDLLHELPHIKTADGNNYGYTEPKMGQRASHGCIRVQRKRTPLGINMRWIWNVLYNGEIGSRLVIWEDWPGRTIPLPEDDATLYYNPQGGENYHDAETCYGVKDRYEPMTAFTYAELDASPFAELTACPYCVPPRRAEDIQAINDAH